jgi:flagellar basal-body rod protein FlgB
MDTSSIPILSILQKRMAWLGQRQTVLSQNIANVDTPGFTPSELKSLDFSKALRDSTSSVSLRVTNARHIPLSPKNGGYDDYQVNDKLADPTGNTVSIEQEMIKVADNQAQYQAAVNIYSKTLSMMRTAIGKGS